MEINDLHKVILNFHATDQATENEREETRMLGNLFWGARPSQPLRGASRAPLRLERKNLGCAWRDANHGGRDNRAPQDSRKFASIRGCGLFVWRVVRRSETIGKGEKQVEVQQLKRDSAKRSGGGGVNGCEWHFVKAQSVPRQDR